MKVLGIIGEYNPFHNGHEYHLNISKEKLKPDYTIAIISGNFTQRGSCSIIDKWTKTKIALDSGIDLVIELPIVVSVSSAEKFAYGALKILDSLNIVNNLSFGIESEDIDLLDKIASVLVLEPNEYKEILNNNLDLGYSFPLSREIAITKYLNLDKNNIFTPNNILGIEYLKAIKKLNSRISPLPIKRNDNGYNSLDINSKYASGKAIRSIISSSSSFPKEKLKNCMPKYSLELLEKAYLEGYVLDNLNPFSNIIIYKIRTMTIEEISNIPDVSEGLEFLIKKAADTTNDLSELISIIKSKRYTETRISRILTCILLNIKKSDQEIQFNSDISYIRILGFNKKGEDLLSIINKQNPDLNIITSVKKYLDSNSDDILLKKEIEATNIYTLGYKNNSVSNLDFSMPIIKK